MPSETAMPAALEEYIGLFDVDGYDGMVGLLREALGLEEGTIHERLFHEALQTGWNVQRAAREFNLVPHVYNEEMERFYQATDAFVFELLVVHLTPNCRLIDRRVAEAVHDCAVRTGRPQRILALGDGIGTDSLRFASLGHDVTYFEFEGYSSAVARTRFRRAGVEDRITVIQRLEEIPRGGFDVVVNREVLEHVADPPAVVDDIWHYLRPGGVAVVTESFARVEPSFPTHLASNLRYAAHTPVLFVEAGFRLLGMNPDGRPMVFQKTDRMDRGRFHTLPGGVASRLKRLVRHAAGGRFQPGSR